MDPKNLGVARYDAGQRFLAAVRELGLRPDALFWAYDKQLENFVLVLITNFFDFAGPLEVSRRLFAAYRASATPKEIDPFLVRVHSPHQRIFSELRIMLMSGVGHKGVPKEIFDREVVSGERQPALDFAFEYGGLESYGVWVYHSSKQGPRPVMQAEVSWRRFDRNVEALAA
jgi:hypothetical protein